MSSTRTRRWGRVAAGVAALVFATAFPAAAADGPNLVVNGNFASPSTATSQTVTSLPGWNLIDNEAVISGPGLLPVPAGSSAGTQTLSLNTTKNISVEQAVPTVVGKTYRLTFSLGGFHSLNHAVNGAVRINGVSVWPINFNTNQTSPTNPGWVSRTVTFTATTTTALLNFQSTTPGSEGPLITNVAINEIEPAGAPLADSAIAAVLLLGVATVAVVVVTRRRQSSSAS